VFLRFLREFLEFLVDAMDPVLLQQRRRGRKVEKFFLLDYGGGRFLVEWWMDGVAVDAR
jgi:hypothetical protein